jgi:TolA-binding protein
MTTLDDLLIKQRRGALSEAEARRLEIAMRSSSEFEIAARLGAALERDGRPQEGDEQLIESALGAVERARWGRPSSAAARRLLRLAAVPVFIASVAAAAVGVQRFLATPLAPTGPSAGVDRGGRAPEGVATKAVVPEAVVTEAVVTEAAPARSVEPRPQVAAAPPLAREPAPLAPPRARTALRQGARRRAATEPREAVASATPVPVPVPVPPSGVGPAEATGESARAMFQRAGELRRSDWVRAEAVYGALIDRHPSSEEAGIAEMALAKHALEDGRALEALTWFRVHQRRTNSGLAPEAIWGEARALESRGQFEAARSAWQRLVERYPDSAYAAVARQRLEE